MVRDSTIHFNEIKRKFDLMKNVNPSLFGQFLFVLALFSLASQTLQAQSNTANPDHTVFLIGNTGGLENAPSNLELLQKDLAAAGKNATLIFLGDNMAHQGMPSKSHPKRTSREQSLVKQLDLIKAFQGKTYILPGDKDWKNGKPDGWRYIQQQEDFIEEYLDDDEVFFPKEGHPGPSEFKLDDGLFLILFDMQWMLHRWNKPLQDHPLEYHNNLDVLVEINELLEKHENDHVILASHHPIVSYGSYGGKFSLKQHIFPLTDANKSLYLPLPVIGSLYPLYRSTAGGPQDIANPKYKGITLALEAFLKQYPNVLYVSGHEASMQHIEKEGVHYIVSGSGAQSGFVKQGKHAKFVTSRTGFSKLKYDRSGATNLEFWVADENSPSGEKLYDQLLYNRKYIGEAKTTIPRFDFKNKSIRTIASNQYEASPTKKTFFGTNYRDVWKEEIEVDFFDITKEKGGLIPIQMGGGLQTKSLRLEAEDGKQYVLRSVEKYPEKSLPQFLRKTIAASILQDQISASHPYAAFVVPPMAEAAGIYHTNPRLVYIPRDGAFGKYTEIFENTLAIFEERPAKDWSDAAFFGNSDKIISSPKVLKGLKKDNDNRVDQPFVLKSRMFDMIIADWDRHEDQWRWASYEDKGGKLYKPIPRDRDQAFFVNEGVFPKIASRKWAVPKVEGFNNDIRWSPGFNFNARYFDRTFINGLSREDWKEISKELQEQLSDEVIENAIKEWPEQIYELSGVSTTAIIKARRDNLDGYTMELYDYMAEEVEILGSDKKESILIEKLSPEEMKVTMKKISKKGKEKHTLFERTFKAEETREIRIYGFGGKDKFKIVGDDKTDIKVRIIGGRGEDVVEDNSAKGTSKRMSIYDTKSTTVDNGDSGLKIKTSDHPDINLYRKYEFQYDQLLPLASIQLNQDDGVFLGGGFLLTKYGWRKAPFASRHFLSGDLALATGAFNIKYKGEFTDVLGKWDLELEAKIQKPFSIDNFFGLGNESVYDFDNTSIDFYRARFENNLYRAALVHPVGAFSRFAIGVQHLGVEVENREGRFISEPNAGGVDTSNLFDNRRYYTGLYTGFQFDSRDNLLLTTRGIFWNTEFIAQQGLNDLSTDLQRLSSELSLYYSFKYPAVVTLASRTGVAHNFGDFEFYNANKLGGISNLRGFRRTRFHGQTSLYQNLDLRIKLFSFKSYILPGNVGILGFYDIGRVWIDGEDSDKWHRSAGAGLYISPFGKAVLAFNMAFTEEENLPSVTLGFFF